MPLWYCYYHIVWTTKHRAPSISTDIERLIYHVAYDKALELESPIVAMNCVSDHTHVLASIAPKLSVAEWVRNIKGITTHEVNAMFPDLPDRFAWQSGYAALTVSREMLPRIQTYISNQKIHHQHSTLDAELEQLDD
jgi:REP element-mobilizing transposase RayT